MFTMSELYCSTCHSQGRMLFTFVNSSNVDLSPVLNFKNNQLLICWECRAVLTKIEKFMKQVKLCQQVLKSCQPNKIAELQTYSKLRKSLVKNVYDKKYYYREDTDPINNYDPSSLAVKTEIAIDQNVKCQTTNFQEDDICKEDAIYIEDAIYKEDAILQQDEIYQEDDCQEGGNLYDNIFIITKTAIQENTEKISNDTITKAQHMEIPQNTNTDKKSSSHSNTQKHTEKTCKKSTEKKAKEKAQCEYKTEKKSKESNVKHFCEGCKKEFRTKKYFKSHIKRMHSAQHHFACPVCNIQFRTELRQKKHTATHSEELERQLTYCKVCDTSYKTVYTYRSHLKNNANHVKEGYKCDKCNKMFASKSYWKRHIDFYHLNKYTYKCEECDKTFFLKCRYEHHRLYKHNRDSDRSRDHECSQCGKKFYTRRTLKTHSLIHSSERKYLCSQCGRSFTQESSMYKHIRQVHSDKKVHSDKRVHRNKL